MLVALALGLSQAVAPSPPMGWNSYDCYGYAVTESQVLANAQFMARHLSRYGWKYVVIDYVWAMPDEGPNTPGQNADFEPRLNMDGYGRLVPDTARFPSSAGGVGFRSIAERLHSEGLKFGIHLMRGIPKQAVAANLPIEGSDYRTAQANDPNGRQCSWLNHMDPLNMSAPAGQAYLDSIFRLYAGWGVDFVKVDDISDPYSRAVIQGYRDAIEHCGRPMVLSLSPGPTHLENADDVEAKANMWRLLGDLWDDWPQLDSAFDVSANWNPYRKVGHWPDLDMLPLGQLRVYGPLTGPPNTPSRFTPEEAKTLMTLWMITKSPLMFGGDLTKSDAYTISLLENSEGLIPNQREDYWPRQLQGGGQPVWLSEAKRSRSEFLAVFNRRGQESEVTVDLRATGLTSGQAKDIWSKALLPYEGATISVEVPAHGCRYLRFN